ncbi:hypothetical protein IV203_014080 [Nitzschia inconspicua]|uniref:Uncharacterized protein n=1 Tax=Nitzschia inconspicua TaxID=303405 RepID=A0A9K3M7V8_9STRA|nr:hypothetical protein IV203_014080 [Nitzschia inconspicua]
MKSVSLYWVAFLLASLVSFPSTDASASFLVGNTRGDVPVSLYNEATGTFASFLPPEVELIAPDHMVMVGDMLYISHGDSLNTSAIFRMNMADGTYDTSWAVAEDIMYRPYGFALDSGVMYVASFLSDQILMFEEDTGEYMGEFVAGDGTEEGLCNGPNQIAIHNGKLYLTTQGSVAIDGAPEYLFPSQIVVYDLETAEGEVYIPPPEPLEDSFGFVSMLGIVIAGCDDDLSTSNCTMYTTDFGGGLRAYDLETTDLLYAVETTIDEAFTGSLTLTDGGMIVVPIFADEASGSLLQFDAMTGEPMGSTEGSPVLVGPTTDLARPVGVLFYMEEDTVGTMPTDAPMPTEAPVGPAPVSVGETPGEGDMPSAAPVEVPEAPAPSGASIMKGVISSIMVGAFSLSAVFLLG